MSSPNSQVYYLNICNQLTHILHKMQFLCSQSDILKILFLINLLFSFEFLVELPMSKYNFILRTLFKDVVQWVLTNICSHVPITVIKMQNNSISPQNFSVLICSQSLKLMAPDHYWTRSLPLYFCLFQNAM